MFRILAIVLLAYVIAYPRFADNQATAIEEPLVDVRPISAPVMKFLDTINPYQLFGVAVAAVRDVTPNQ